MEDEDSVHHIGKESIFRWLTKKSSTANAAEVGDDEKVQYTDEDFAVLRHIMTEAGISSRKFTATFAGFFYFFKRQMPDPKDLISRRTLKAKFMRLAYKDAMDTRAAITSLRDICDSHTISYMTDCSFYGEERMVSYFSYPNPDMTGPTTCFTGIGAIADKDAAACSKEALNRLVAMLGPDGMAAMFGSCQDHAALNELKSFFDEAATRGIAMERAFEHCIKLGDDFHKLSLVDRAASFGAFGGARGVGVHSHLQLLYSRHNIHTKKASTLQAVKRDYMGKTVKKPPAPMETRWATIALASIDFLDELENESENPDFEGCYATPHMWKHVTDVTKNLVHEMATDIATLSMDLRVQVACQFEAELYTRFYRRCLTFNKVPSALPSTVMLPHVTAPHSHLPPLPPLLPQAKSSLGYHHMFKSGDMPKEVQRRRAWWRSAVASPKTCFPATFARIQKMRESTFVFGAMGKEEPTSAADMADLYEKKVEAGIAAGYKEFKKMYAVWEEVPTLLFHLRSKKHRQVVAQFVVESLGEMPEVQVRDDAMQAWFDANIVRDRDVGDLQTEMRGMCHSLGLDGGADKWPDVIDDLCELASEPFDGGLDSVGTGSLHRFLYFNIDSVPVMNLIVELSFSCLKTTEKTNNGSETTDLTMATKMQLFHPARVERLAMKKKDGKDYVNPQHLDNATQVVHWSIHCAKISARYNRLGMVTVPHTEAFRNQKTSNTHSSGNKDFVAAGKILRHARVRKGTTLNLAEAAMKIMGQDILLTTSYKPA